MQHGSRTKSLALVLALALLLPASQAWAWGSVSNCMNCHSGFRDGSPSLHSLHTDYVNSCQDCHQSSLSTPLSTNSSANYAEYSCNGCHYVEGLAIKHGFDNCGCHSGVTAPAAGERFLPYFYQEGRSGVVNPCRTNAANGGEDWDGDGFGLDNDGDDVYDASDSDCEGAIPVNEEAWGTLKTLFDA